VKNYGNPTDTPCLSVCLSVKKTSSSRDCVVRCKIVWYLSFNLTRTRETANSSALVGIFVVVVAVVVVVVVAIIIIIIIIIISAGIARSL